jgi:hypothetical protein
MHAHGAITTYRDVSPDFRRLAAQLKLGNACRERGKSFL